MDEKGFIIGIIAKLKVIIPKYEFGNKHIT